MDNLKGSLLNDVVWSIQKIFRWIHHPTKLMLAMRPSKLMKGKDSDRLLNAPLAKQPLRPLPQQMICGYCMKLGHYKCDCRMANGLCLTCEAGGHLIKNFLIRRIGNITLIRPTLPASLVRRNPGPVGRRTSFLSQRYSSNQAQRRPRARIDGKKRQICNLTKEEAQISERIGTGSGSQYLKLEP